MVVGSGERTTLRRGRAATSLLFLLFGTALGTWTSRIPAVKTRLGLSDGSLSIALLAFALGAIVGMVVLGRLVDRFSSTSVMVPMAVAEGVLLVPAAYVPSLVTLAAALFVFGAVHGTLNIAMNANAIEVQRACGRPIMSSFHAVYSIGGFLGAAIGGTFARADVGAGPTFLAVGGLVVVLAICALVGEGTAADWSAVYTHENLGATAAFAVAPFAAFSIMMTVGRLLGDRLAAALGPVLLVRCCGVLASVGMTAALLIGQPIAAVLGFGC